MTVGVYNRNEDWKKLNPNFGMSGKKHTKEAKEKISLFHKDKRHSPRTEFKKGNIPWNKGKKGLQIPWNKGIPRSEKTKEKLRKARLRQRFPQKFTNIEIALQNELIKRDIPFKTQVPIVCCVPDIFIEPNKILKENGFSVHRFWEHEIKESPRKCIDKIVKVKK